MKNTTKIIFEQLFRDYPILEACRSDVESAFDMLKSCYSKEGKVMVCGNGGSASDSEHIVGELMKGFMCGRSLKSSDREKLKAAFPKEGEYLADKLQGALPAISLVSHSALAFAYINDVAPDMVFAQQVYGYGKKGDVLIGLSTSGNSGNVINAIKTAKAFGIYSIGMTGADGGLMKDLCDTVIRVPEKQTYKVQELHLPVYHAVCAMLEAEFFVD